MRSSIPMRDPSLRPSWRAAGRMVVALALAACAPEVRPPTTGDDTPPDPTDTDTDVDTDTPPPATVEARLREVVAPLGLTPWGNAPVTDPALYEAGRQLFIEPLLVGGVASAEQQACVSCHGAWGPQGRDFAMKFVDDDAYYGRSVPTFTDLARPEVTSWFWDGLVRVEGGRVRSPIEALHPEVTDPLVVAMMVGGAHVGTAFRTTRPLYPPFEPGDQQPVPEDIEERWSYALDRVLTVAAHRRNLREAFPAVGIEELTYVHVGQALAAFVGHAYTSQATPWDRWLAGEADLLSDSAKEGALLFFGRAGCATCHAGSAFSDGAPHNLAVPQFGPGVGSSQPEDLGAFDVRGDPSVRHAFVTPRLRNLSYSRPFMHNGAFDTLEGAILHHLDPLGSLRRYTSDDVPPVSRFVRNNAGHLPQRLPLAYPTPADAVAAMAPTLSPLLPAGVTLDDQELTRLVDFLRALEEPEFLLHTRALPEQAPSGWFPWFF